MRRAALALVIAPVCVALVLFGPQIAAHALLSLGLPSSAARLFGDPAWKGAALYADGRWNDAADAFAQDWASAYNLGNALARAGRYEEAIAAFDRALAVNADDVDAAFNKSLLEAALKGDPAPVAGGVNGVVANSPATKTGGSRDRPPSFGETGGSGAGLAAGRETESGGGDGGAASKDGRAEGETMRFRRATATGAAGAADGDGRTGADLQTSMAELLRERNNRMRRRLTEGGVHPSLEWLQALPDDPGRFLKLRILAEKMRRLKANGGPIPEDD